ncbi:hypothetical protein [Kineosporia sp. R_H_3]|uniref:hypothetical protein n=1 Tax=Kineosporia sp. R_H_3 TaxID=1961848 RepID=UPI000B4B8FAE|nr:hypothetical protein [Kineosporia sp. R_H_3]
MPATVRTTAAVDDLSVDLSAETVELLPQRAALGHGGINITTITGVNIAIAVNAGSIHSAAWASAWQGIGAHA